MKERPIIFSGEMVRAILEGRKTVTRRVIKPQPPEGYEWSEEDRLFVDVCGSRLGLLRHCQYERGMALWVRETWRALDDYNGVGNTSTSAEIEYRADSAREWRDIPGEKQEEWFYKLTPWVNGRNRFWRPSIFMPRWASRITLEIADVKIERIQDISEEDAKAEGIAVWPRTYITKGRWLSGPVAGFAQLWNSLNEKRGFGWDANPWVWVVAF
jgi:hypothetical protein